LLELIRICAHNFAVDTLLRAGAYILHVHIIKLLAE